MKRTFFELVVGGIIGAVAVWIAKFKSYSKEIEQKDWRINKFKNYFDVTNEWIRLRNQGRRLEEFFLKNQWSNIAIYGMGELGNRLVEELKDSSITIKYGIDKNVDRVDGGIEIKKLEEKLFPVDVIVITPFFMYKEIEEELMELVNYPIVSIEDVVNFL